MKKGIELPEGCFCEEECIPLAQIISSDGGSFLTVCERINYTPEDERDEQDKYRVWFHNDKGDVVQNYDKRDLIDTASVLMQAVSIIQNKEEFPDD